MESEETRVRRLEAVAAAARKVLALTREDILEVYPQAGATLLGPKAMVAFGHLKRALAELDERP